MKITFLGAVETVTGSKYLIEHDGTKILVDCGMFQGPKEVRMLNWQDFPIDPKTIKAIVVTHAHIDHIGYIPRFMNLGFRGKVYSSEATYALSKILLRDSGAIQEEHAYKVNKYGYSDHKPALPLYTKADAEKALTFFQTVTFDTFFEIGSLSIKLTRAGHILGASSVQISDGSKKITFSGDLGRPDQLIMKEPEHIEQTDYLVLESTYGDRLHDKEDPIKLLGAIVNETVKKGGKLIIPAFAVGRTQMLLYALYQLKQKKNIPDIPVFVDSPMATAVTELYCQFKDEHKLSIHECETVFDVATYVRTRDESKGLNSLKGSAIIIAGSGMLDGGRVLHHLIHTISDIKNTILMVGYQAAGTKGRLLIQGAHNLKIYGKKYSVKAVVKEIHSWSAHADYNELLQWLSHFKQRPQKIFLTHGDKESNQSLKQKIEQRFGLEIILPKYLDFFDLG